MVLLISHMLNASLLNLNWHVHATTSLFCEKVDDPGPDTLPVKFLTLPPKKFGLAIGVLVFERLWYG